MHERTKQGFELTDSAREMPTAEKKKRGWVRSPRWLMRYNLGTTLWGMGHFTASVRNQDCHFHVIIGRRLVLRPGANEIRLGRGAGPRFAPGFQVNTGESGWQRFFRGGHFLDNVHVLPREQALFDASLVSLIPYYEEQGSDKEPDGPYRSCDHRSPDALSRRT
ncbi:hypothetical protein FB451DRAFT_1176727 [Mycena latifolia]|nr:hypothetical protein FB451DRAFT_1176727 [Mycena latifolia]